MMGYKYVYGGCMQGLGLCELPSGGVCNVGSVQCGWTCALDGLV